MTYSIVARDADTGEIGVAVQSHFLAVGSVCPWARAGVGAVATQAFAEPSYGPLGLELMAAGKPASAALEGLLASDPASETRQVAMVDGAGEVAAHTGTKCIADAGHRVGLGYSVQANMMRRDTVPSAMARAFEAESGPLALRLVAALDAAEAEGGDIRGRQSAALLVVGAALGAPWTDVVVDVRVDDHTDPLGELRRITEMRLAIARLNTAGDVQSDPAALDRARADVASFAASGDGNPEMAFWLGIALAGAGRVDEGRLVLQRAYDADEGWIELVRRLPAAGRLPDDADLLARLLP